MEQIVRIIRWTGDQQTKGVVSNFVTFHFSFDSRDKEDKSSAEESPNFPLDDGTYGVSDAAGMLLRLTVSVLDIIVIVNVALRRGSS